MTHTPVRKSWKRPARRNCWSTLETLFEQGDIVSLHLRLTPDTEHMIGMQYFSRMKKTAYFINTARGGLVDQLALVEALQQGCMAGAALDVYDSEPLAVDDPLLQMDNVLLTPHIAGTTVDAIPRAPFLLMREVDRFLADGVTDRVVNHVSITLE
ncbi:MAG: NAD(P)-dependent oxidoreductase [Butyricicoccus sp.]